jgi:hypothetical protein
MKGIMDNNMLGETEASLAEHSEQPKWKKSFGL